MRLLAFFKDLFIHIYFSFSFFLGIVDAMKCDLCQQVRYMCLNGESFAFLRDYFNGKKFLVVSFYGFSSKHFNTFSSQTFLFLAESTANIKENFIFFLFFLVFRFHDANLSDETIIILKSGTILNIIIIPNNNRMLFFCLFALLAIAWTLNIFIKRISRGLKPKDF